MKDFEMRNFKDRAINNLIKNHINSAFKQQGIRSKLARNAMLETRKLHKSYSSNKNYYSEIILIGGVQVIVFGICIQDIEFVQSFCIKSYPALDSLELCKHHAQCFLALQEELNEIYEEGRIYAA
jgi:hypothetical protein